MESSEKSIRSAEEIADEILQAVQPHLSEGPYTGHGYICQPEVLPSAKDAVAEVIKRHLR